METAPEGMPGEGGGVTARTRQVCWAVSRQPFWLHVWMEKKKRKGKIWLQPVDRAEKGQTDAFMT